MTRAPQASPSPTPPMPESTEVLVIGGAQAGLSAGYYLAQAEIPFLILDAGARVEDSASVATAAKPTIPSHLDFMIPPLRSADFIDRAIMVSSTRAGRPEHLAAGPGSRSCHARFRAAHGTESSRC